jgi:hypothetical protein
MGGISTRTGLHGASERVSEFDLHTIVPRTAVVYRTFCVYSFLSTELRPHIITNISLLAPFILVSC